LFHIDKNLNRLNVLCANIYFMKRIFLALAMLGIVATAQAQFGYVFKYNTSTYVPLTGATDATGGDIWGGNNIAIPTGFNYKLGTKSMDHMDIAFSTIGPATDTALFSVLSTFVPWGALTLGDRGLVTGTAVSPIRYKTEGTTPNRIFKLEFSNAGIMAETDLHDTLEDYLNLQIWVYETTNVMEFHYGPSQMIHKDYYFDTATGVEVGFAKNLDLMGETFDYVYFLKGSSNAPTLDSTDDPDADIKSLDDYPSDGMVYRFIPYDAATGFGDPELVKAFNVYPTTTTSTVFISNKQQYNGSYEVLSVTGQKMNLGGTLTGGNNSVNVSMLPAGMYMMHLYTDKGVATYKFNKQ